MPSLSENLRSLFLFGTEISVILEGLTRRQFDHILSGMRSLLLPARFFIASLFFCLALTFSLRSATHTKWIEVRSPHFTVVSDAGEKQARQTADQFEQIREVFQNAFPTLRPDIGKPVIIFALKNEASMKSLLPAYWEVEGHAHPAGLYIPAEDKHCAVIRTNVQTDNPYEVVYHEYAHALENLNFQGLPLWLSEGFAEFLGNSKIYDGFVEIGVVSPHHLAVLRESKLIPIDVLLQVDSKSPYYNEKGPASLFYAESWALVHYLMLDPDARQKQLLQNFLAVYQNTSDQLLAAKQSFGNLPRFAETVEQYSRQQHFLVRQLNTALHVDPRRYASRALSSAESNALRGDFYTRTHRPIEAKAALEAALQQDPDLALTHEALGMLALSQHQSEKAEAEFTEAVQLNSSSFLAYYFSARVRMRDQMNSPEEINLVTASLEKAISLNSRFAPAYEALSSIYSLSPENSDKAIAAGKKAMQLEPGTFSYALSYGYVLLRIGKVADAKIMASRIQAAARKPDDQSAALRLAEVVAEREAYDARIAARALQPQTPDAHQVSAGTLRPPGASTTAFAYEPPSVNKHSGEDEFAVDGTVLSAECPLDSPGKVTLMQNKRNLTFTIPNLRELQVLERTDDVSSHPPACTTWKGRHARLFFYKVQDKQSFGELSTIQFF